MATKANSSVKKWLSVLVSLVLVETLCAGGISAYAAEVLSSSEIEQSLPDEDAASGSSDGGLALGSQEVSQTEGVEGGIIEGDAEDGSQADDGNCDTDPSIASSDDESLSIASSDSASIVTSWEWSDPQGLLKEVDGVWGLVLAGASVENPVTRDALLELLPAEISAVIESGEERLLALTWDLSIIPETGAVVGEFVVSASFADDAFSLADGVDSLDIELQLGGAELHASLPSGEPNFQDNIVSGVSPNGTTINLFDYWLTGQADADNNDPAWRINQGINNGHALLFRAAKNETQGIWNEWTGDESPRSGIVAEELENGYPRLNVDMSTATDDNFKTRDGQESLAYLFDPNISHEGKQSFKDVQGLLQVDRDGYYYYDSTQNYAVYYEEDNAFTLYDIPGVRSGGSSGTAGQFFPFNAAENKNGSLINDFKSNDSKINHYFGVHMSTRFIQQYGGHIDENETKAVTYHFSGDDDVWIFIDGKLVADLGGIHDAAAVDIDFSTGEIKINGASQSKTLGDMMGLASDTLPDNTYHTLDFFYLERGNVDSNMNLKYNLVTIPESSLIKVDQLGEPVPGTEFSLYSIEEYEKYKQDPSTANPIAVGVTDNTGEFVFMGDDELPITLQQLYDAYGKGSPEEKTTDLYLIETETPVGYRSRGPIELYFYETNRDEILLLSNSVWDEGVYSMPKVTTTTNNKIYFVDDLHEPVTLTGAGAVENPLMFAVVFQKQKDGSWRPISGDPVGGWHLQESGNWDGVLAAVRDNPYIFQLASSGAYQVEIDNLPGDIREYSHITQNLDSATYAVGYYYTTASSLNQATADNTWRIDSDPTTPGIQGLDRVFSMDLYVSNIKNRLLVQKVDEDGDPVNGATFGLYEKSDVSVDEQGNAVIRDGATAYDTLTTAHITDILNLDGGGIFPTAGKMLNEGEYYLVETSAPVGYKVNAKAIHVLVDDTGVYADAGVEGDGVTVLRGVGSVVRSMIQFAANDHVDTTLQGIKAALAANVTYCEPTGEETIGHMSWEKGNSDEAGLHLQFANANKMLDYGLYDGNADATIDDLTCETDAGWSKLIIWQCFKHDDTIDTSLKTNIKEVMKTTEDPDPDITNLFSGTVTVRVANEETGNLRISKSVAGDGAPSDQEFTFEITDKNSNAPISGTYRTQKSDGSESSITFNGGKATITLKDGENLTILALPKGTTFKVVEKDMPGFVSSVQVGNQPSVVSSIADEVVIGHNTSEQDAVEVAYINTWTNNANLKIEKTVTGNSGDRDKEFTFQIALKDRSGNPLSGSYSCFDESGNPETIVLDSNGEGAFALKHGQSITILNLPQESAFAISETNAEDDGYTTTTKVTTPSMEGGPVIREGIEAHGTCSSSGSFVVSYLNDRNFVPDTGVTTDSRPWMLVAILSAAIGAAMLAVSIGCRRARWHEDEGHYGS